MKDTYEALMVQILGKPDRPKIKKREYSRHQKSLKNYFPEMDVGKKESDPVKVLPPWRRSDKRLKEIVGVRGVVYQWRDNASMTLEYDSTGALYCFVGSRYPLKERLAEVRMHIRDMRLKRTTARRVTVYTGGDKPAVRVSRGADGSFSLDPVVPEVPETPVQETFSYADMVF